MIRRVLRVLLKAVIAGIATVVLLIGGLLATLWLEHNRTLELPEPTGPHPVGRVVSAWVDSGRADPFAPTPGVGRELLVWMWYPAVSPNGEPPSQYLPQFWREAQDTAASWFLTTFLWRNPAKIRAHSFDNAGLSSSAMPSYPVVLLRSGIGAAALDYTTLAEDLASHGYIVVSADAPYSTWAVVMPDGRVIHKTDRGNPGDAVVSEADRDRMLDDLLEVWVADTRFLLDGVTRLNAESAGRFSGHFDLEAVGVIGHSFGGATSARVCYVDKRCRAGIDIDGALQGPAMSEGIGRPFMFLLSDHSDLSDPAERSIMDDIRSVASRDSSGGLVVSFVDAHHFSFSDTPLLQSRILRSLLVALGGPGGGLDQRAGLAMTTRYVRAFLDVQLRGFSPDALYSVPLMEGAKLGAN